ncbi:MAG: hypothetical protein DCF25_12655 [Leptolyngbya foveolarum]|uniref:Uncharacterized protein n=1 Tax=Leptolyngbya foveolarum TaxID=47253 RepID=A0A2W4UAJ6_9CYAN|nr:MAG: hypothetical protein DCF25_12655 [Leptolyngbya foveolarum]
MYGKRKNLYRLTHYQAALESYEAALSVRDDAYEVWYGRGKALTKLNRLEDAIESFERSLQLNPQSAKTWASLGQALMHQEKDEAAISKFDKAIELLPADSSKAAPFWTHKGFLLKRLGQYQAALGCFDRSIKLNPKAARTWHYRGLTLMNLGQYDQAYESFESGLKFQAYDHKSWLSLGWALEKMGAYEKAIEAYNQSLTIEPDQPFAFYCQARCYALLQNQSSAMEHLRRAISLHPESYAQRAMSDPVLRGVQTKALVMGALSSR